jgi:hypothetical protein
VTALARYDAMVYAIAECHRVDEVKEIHDKARALEVYAKQAMNVDAERKATEVRIRAEIRAGELLSKMERGKAGRPKKNGATVAPNSDYQQALTTAGVNKRTAERWQELAAVPKSAVEAALRDPEKKPTTSDSKGATMVRAEQALARERGKGTRLTDSQIQSKRRRGLWLTEALGGRGAGRLVLRVAQSGERLFYFRYTDAERRQRTIALGAYDREGRSGLTLAQARDKAAEYSRRYREGARDLREQLEAERRAKAVRQAAELAERERAAREAGRGTVGKLLDAYAEHLEKKGRESARNARSLFRLHVFEAWPQYAEKKAAELRPGEVTTILRTVAERGKGRTAAKLRAYMRAAYALALRAEHDATAPAALRAFGVETNPVAVTAALAEFNRTRDRVLTAGELGAFLRAVEALEEGPARSALLLALHLGGQRPAQLLRAAPADVDLHGRTIALRDSKGKRVNGPRLHVLPLTERAAAIVGPLLESNAEAPWLFSADGKRHTRPETLGVHVRGISEELAKDPDLKRAKASQGAFELRDIRRTCETMLAALGVSRDVRAQIQSHGLGGVQQRHYDRHDYMAEKRAALEAWGSQLERLKSGRPAADKVIPIRRGGARARGAGIRR